MQSSRVLILSVLALLPLIPPAWIQTHESAVSQPEPLTVTNVTRNMAIDSGPAPPANQAGIDVKQHVTYSFEPNGRVTYTDLSGANFTLSALGIGFGAANVTLPFIQFSYNSTTVQYSLVNAKFLGQNANLTVTFQKIIGSLNLNVTLTGTVTLPSSRLFLRLLGSGPALRLTKYSVFHGSLGFDWSDTANSSPVFNNQTQTLAWTVGQNFRLDPLAVDNSNTNICIGITTCVVGPITTTNGNDLILIGAYEDSGGFTIQGGGIVDTAGLVYKPRGGGQTWVDEEWYAKALTPLAADNISVSLTGTPSSTWALLALAISGADLNSPFDQSMPLTAKGSTCSGWPTVTVTKTPEMVIAFEGNNGGINMLADSGYTLIQGSQTEGAETTVYTTPVSAVQLSFQQKPCQSGASWGMIIDGICASGQSGCVGGGLSPNPTGFKTASVAGITVPVQLADSGVISFMFFLSAIILVSSIDFKRWKGHG